MNTGPQQPGDPVARLQFDDPLSARSADDTDTGWGEASTAGASGGGQQAESAADLARFLDEKPPHHL